MKPGPHLSAGRIALEHGEEIARQFQKLRIFDGLKGCGTAIFNSTVAAPRFCAFGFRSEFDQAIKEIVRRRIDVSVDRLADHCRTLLPFW